MKYQAPTNPETITVKLSSEIVAVAIKRAKAMGMDVSEYVAHIVNDELTDPWRMPTPAEVDARWEREIAEFDAQEKTKPRPVAKTVSEFRKLLEQETAQIPDDEEH